MWLVTAPISNAMIKTGSCRTACGRSVARLVVAGLVKLRVVGVSSLSGDRPPPSGWRSPQSAARAAGTGAGGERSAECLHASDLIALQSWCTWHGLAIGQGFSNEHLQSERRGVELAVAPSGGRPPQSGWRSPRSAAGHSAPQEHVATRGVELVEHSAPLPSRVRRDTNTIAGSDGKACDDTCEFACDKARNKARKSGPRQLRVRLYMYQARGTSLLGCGPIIKVALMGAKVAMSTIRTVNGAQHCTSRLRSVVD